MKLTEEKGIEALNFGFILETEVKGYPYVFKQNGGVFFYKKKVDKNWQRITQHSVASIITKLEWEVIDEPVVA